MTLAQQPPKPCNQSILSPMYPLKGNMAPIGYDSTDALIGTAINPPKIDNKSIESASRRLRIMYWLQVISTLSLIILIILFFVYHEYISLWLESYIQLVRDEGVLFAPILYMMTCCLCMILLIPQTLLSIFGGFIFVKLLGLKGIITTIFIVFVGCSFGSIISFILSRYLYQKINCIKNILCEYSEYEEIYNALKGRKLNQKNGFLLIFCMRMIPWTPYVMFNLSMATTNAKLIHFIYANIGMIPDIIMYCFIGAFIDSISRLISNDNSHDWASFILIFTLIGTALSIFVIIYIGKIAYGKYKTILCKTAAQKQKIFTVQREYSMSSSGTIKDVSLASNVSDFL